MAHINNQGMKDLIVVINKLQDVFTVTGLNLGLELPQIAVVGGQSAGKSSVLENFVGKDFLPRGSGIVTRRPLVLQLYNNPDEEYAEFLHTQGKYYDFHKVRDEIQAETDRETGTNKGISKKPINLRIYSPHVLDLTLIDLPGLTKVAVGDQPDDIEDQIMGMIMEYIVQENTIILAVTPANQDLANSDALKLARKVDKEGNRTIGVITKLDLMDEGTDARDIFENKFLPLKKGYIGVVNRSQRDIANSKDISASLQSETTFFKNSPYKHLIDRMGTNFLQKKLNEDLGNHIKETLPSIRSNLKKKLLEITAQLKLLGYFNTNDRDKTMLLCKLIENFKKDLHCSIEGNDNDVATSTINGGALINRTFYCEVQNLLDSIDTAPSDVDIGLALVNLHGYRNPLFPPEKAFDKTIRTLIEGYKDPLAHSVTVIKGIFLDVINDCALQLNGFPKLRDEILYLLTTKLFTNEETTTKHLHDHIEAQKSFMNTKHPDFQQFKLETSGQDMPTRTAPQAPPRPSVLGPDIRERSGSQWHVGEASEAAELDIHQGMMMIHSSGFRGAKETACSITQSNFVMYNEGKRSYHKVNLKKVLCTCETLGPKRDRCRFVLYRQDDQPVYKADKKLELSCARDESDAWTSAFQTAGIFIDIKGSTESLSGFSGAGVKSTFTRLFKMPGKKVKDKPHTVEEVLTDPDTKDQTSLLQKMVASYMRIVDTTIRDIVPKYISFALIQATLGYVRDDMLGELLSGRDTKEKKEELMEDNSDDTRKIEELLRVKTAIENAITIVTDLYRNKKI